MKRWFQFIEDLSVPSQRFVSDQEFLGEYEGHDFRRGSKIPNWSDSYYVKCTDPKADGPIDDVLRNHLGIPIFSPVLMKSLDAMGIEGIQYLPLQVIHVDGRLEHGFVIANILNLVEALDRSKASFDVYPSDYFLQDKAGQLSAVKRFALRSKAISDFDVIRLREFNVAEFVSDRFVRAYRAAGCSGVTFEGILSV